MKLTTHEKRVLRVLDRYINAYLRKRFARAMRTSIAENVLCKSGAYKGASFSQQLHDKARHDLSRFLPWLNTLPNPLTKYPSNPLTGLVTRALYAKLQDVSLEEAAKSVMAAMVPDAVALEMECALPLERRTRKPRPRTLIERRAAKADALLIAWQRKLRMAKNKVRKYQSKVKYYSKKGAEKQHG